MSSASRSATRYERYALIFDPGHSRLGAESLGLVERGIDPLYAVDPDEAQLLALQETGRVGALVVSGALPLELFDVLLERIAPQLWAGPAAVVVAGAPDERSRLRALRDRGISWVLREPYDASEFRFVVSAALATEDKLDPRSGLRVPIALPTAVRCDGASLAAMVRNLSIGGAYLALSPPLAPGSALAATIGLGDRALDVEASVVYRQLASEAGRAEREPGMGVAFRGLTPEDRAALAGFIAERVASFRL